jgi:hypothetical protein
MEDESRKREFSENLEMRRRDSMKWKGENKAAVRRCSIVGQHILRPLVSVGGVKVSGQGHFFGERMEGSGMAPLERQVNRVWALFQSGHGSASNQPM